MKPLSIADLRRQIGVRLAIDEALQGRCRPERVQLSQNDKQRALEAQNCIKKFGSRAGYLYFHAWGIFPSSEKTEQLAEAFALNDLPPGPPELRALSFSAGEFNEAAGIFTLAVRSVWDVYLMDRRTKRVLFASHDEYARASFKLPALS